MNTGSASPHETILVEPLFDFMITMDFSEKLIEDRSYDSDKLDRVLSEKGMEMISPHRAKKPSSKPKAQS